MWWFCPVIFNFWMSITSCIKEITKVTLPMNPRIMLWLDFHGGGVVILRELLAHILAAATLLIAKHWKMRRKVTMMDWIGKIQYMCLINKLTVIIKYRGGQINVLNAFELEWSCFVKSRYRRGVRSQVLLIL